MTDITTRLLSMSEAMYMDRDQDELDALLLEAKGRIEAIEAALNSLSKAADIAYCQSLDQFQRPECLGWAAKAHSGRFGNDEYLGHKRANELMGRHQGIVHALQVIRAALIPQQKGSADAKQ